MGTVIGCMIYLSVLVAVLAGIARIIGRMRRGKAAGHFAPLSLAELQADAPAWSVEVAPTSPTIFGNATTAWFEALLEKTYSAPADGAGAYAYLRDAYVLYLEALAQFLENSLPGAWSGDPRAMASFVLKQNDAWLCVATECTATWLKKVALRQNECAAWHGAAERWDAAILDAKSTLIAPTMPLADSKYQVQIRCTPSALSAEVRRITEAGRVPETGLAEPPTPLAAPGAPATGGGSAQQPPLITTATVPASAPAGVKRHFASAWTLWSIVPLLNWVSWVHAAIRGRHRLYGALAILYALPWALTLSIAKADGAVPPRTVIAIQDVCWLLCIAHVFLMRKRVNRRIAARTRDALW